MIFYRRAHAVRDHVALGMVHEGEDHPIASRCERIKVTRLILMSRVTVGSAARR
jgi:hypothetical protein